MNKTVRQWLEKSEDDRMVARRELGADPPSFDACCFHAQQCAEKLMKAIIISREVLAPRTHDLVALDELLRTIIRDWDWDVQELDDLSRGAVEYRYPAESATQAEATQALDICDRLYAALRPLLGEGG